MRQTEKIQRHDWVDALRGACIIAVVLFHVTIWQFLPAVEGSPLIASAWETLNLVLGGIRMPVLLAISGFLAGNRIREGFRSPRALVRAGNTYYLYFIWTALLGVFYWTLNDETMRHAFIGLGPFMKELIVPTTPLWFIFALSTYTITLVFLRHINARVILAMLAVLTVATISIGEDTVLGLGIKIPQYFVFFAIGVYSSQWLTARARSTSPLQMVILAMALCVALALSPLVVHPLFDGSVFLMRGIIAVEFSFALVGAITRHWTRITSILAALGRRTLEIYVLHIILVFAATAVIKSLVLSHVLSIPAVAMIWPAMMTVAIIAVSIGIRIITDRARLTWIFNPPRCVSTTIESIHRRVSATPPESRRLHTSLRDGVNGPSSEQA